MEADKRYILKFHFISSRKNTLCLKNTPYNQVILKIILNLTRLFANKTQLFCIDTEIILICFYVLQRGKL